MRCSGQRTVRDCVRRFESRKIENWQLSHDSSKPYDTFYTPPTSPSTRTHSARPPTIMALNTSPQVSSPPRPRHHPHHHHQHSAALTAPEAALLVPPRLLPLRPQRRPSCRRPCRHRCCRRGRPCSSCLPSKTTPPARAATRSGGSRRKTQACSTGYIYACIYNKHSLSAVARPVKTEKIGAPFLEGTLVAVSLLLPSLWVV